MNTLMIKDLSIIEQLDRKAMSAVRGGTGILYPSYVNFAPFFAPDHSKKVDATQLISTTINVQNGNCNNAAFVTDVSAKIDPRVTASNNIYMS
ncbi:hypothetical protein [Paraburkholderia strydomiana]|uniref:hypothetical protein n=1 Tax=Paraburkholderia strydomiana TaxID=1245417 RepID=UPI001BEB62E0|nr:hypothetical protein [Paraburkholderia strydomiana]MBT2793961.1 hypothetical protein [Paraburkholderia strydomiana]